MVPIAYVFLKPTKPAQDSRLVAPPNSIHSLSAGALSQALICDPQAPFRDVALRVRPVWQL